MNDMNSHLSNIASALCSTQQHEQALMNHNVKLDDKKKCSFHEAMNIPYLIKDETMKEVNKLACDSILLPIFYQCPEERKKDWIINLIQRNESSSFMG